METNNISTIKTLFQEPMALTHLYLEMYPSVQSYILKNKGTIADAEDIFQEATMLMLEKRTQKSVNIQINVPSYFFGICKNLWRAQLRKRTIPMEDSYLDGFTENNVLEHIEHKDKEQLFQFYFAKIKGSGKQIWDLCFEGKSHSEIANITGLSPGYIRKKKCESKKSLTQMIRQDPIYNELLAV